MTAEMRQHPIMFPDPSLPNRLEQRLEILDDDLTLEESYRGKDAKGDGRRLTYTEGKNSIEPVIDDWDGEIQTSNYGY